MAANKGKHKLEHTLSLPIVNFPKIEDLKLAGVNVKPRQWHDLMIPLHDLVGTMPGLEVEAAGIFIPPLVCVGPLVGFLLIGFPSSSRSR